MMVLLRCTYILANCLFLCFSSLLFIRGVAVSATSAGLSASDGGLGSQDIAPVVLRDGVKRLGFDPFEEMMDAVATMQDRFFQIWVGQWSTTIDWTGAVMGTYLSACMTSMLHIQHSLGDRIGGLNEVSRAGEIESSINRYFSQVISYYFGQNAFDIRNEAYDDMLWVVLGWMESLKFMTTRSGYAAANDHMSSPSWWGNQFSPAFAHRAHIFYDLARSGWDERLCGGGMNWNSRLEPYKNTITNSLFITASVNMYLYHPGDNNTAPYLLKEGEEEMKVIPPARPHDRRYLEAAVTGYQWLKQVNMTNDIGLYVDGYHVRGWRWGQRTCNMRNEMVYTYNQAVLLSGLRGLWESTGNTTYLKDAHELVRNVIVATGWSLETQDCVETDSEHWRGLGSRGILTEACDPSGTCSQDGQTFKGIFFHHLAALCDPLPFHSHEATIPGKTYVADSETASLHRRSCASYVAWVARNAKAALGTKNQDGLFGMWWGGSTDYVDQWSATIDDMFPRVRDTTPILHRQASLQDPLFNQEARTFSDFGRQDVNDRGRGRTIETQGSGLMVVRALFELLRTYGDDLTSRPQV